MMHAYRALGWLSYGGVCKSSLTLLLLSSLTFNEERSGSFASNHFNYLTTWYEFPGLPYLFYFVMLMVMNLVHAFKFSTTLP